jgi:formate hydrogenlyase subunit 3/multisubunit Na+/H+ antiporter MnhD subunit
VTLALAGLALIALAALAAFVVPGVAAAVPGLLAVTGGAVAGVAGVLALFAPMREIGLWDLAGVHLRLALDPLSGAFLLVMALGAPLLLMSGHLARAGRGALLLSYLGCLLLVLAGDAVSFLFAWEMMGLAAYVVSALYAGRPAYRMASFLEVGTLALLLALALMWSRAGSASFAALGALHSPDTLVFLLLVIGFGAKLGVLGLHGWYPDVYASTPGSVAGLYSGPIWAGAIYGLVRLLAFQRPWPLGWGLALLVLGVLTALWATLYSLVEGDGKQLLAYSTVENGGVALLVLGATIVFAGDQEVLLAGLGLVVLLYLAAHHTVSKGLALASFGAVEEATGERVLDRLGGLRLSMPWTSSAGLLGFLSLAAVPPFSGFVVEWFVFMLLFQEFRLGLLGARLALVVAGAVFALMAAMGLVAVIKGYSVAYLGQARREGAPAPREAGWSARTTFVMLALLLAGVSVLPFVLVPWLERPVGALLHVELAGRIAPGNLQLNPAYSSFAAASSTVLAAFVPIVAGLAALATWLAGGRSRRRVPAWVGASGDAGPGVQYGASAYTNPMRVFFTSFYRPQVEREGNHVRTRVRRWFVDDLYPWLSGTLDAVTGRITRLQAGRVTIYTTYILAVFVVALLLARLIG